jgi:mannose-6-phosphate isomerase-like protein (cupin superfamily)
MSDHVNLFELASALPGAWQSRLVGNAAGANFKVVRMDGRAYPEESHAFDEALLVLEGRMNLTFADQLVAVRSGEVYIVPAGVPHAVAEGSHGTLVIIDQDV